MACFGVKRVGLLLGQMSIRSSLSNRHIVPACCFLLQSNGTPSTNQLFRAKHKYVENKLNKPLDFSQGGDSKDQEAVGNSEILFKYRNVPEINSLPDEQKKIFTFEFATSREQLEHRHMLMQDRMTKELGPGPCYEKQIAYMTVKIRNLIPKTMQFRSAKKQKAHLVERIAKRNKLLGYLRMLDFDRYAWIQKELGIRYVPFNKSKYHKRRSNAPRRAEVQKETREMIFEKQRQCEEQFDKELEKLQEEKKELMEEINKLGLDKQKIIEQFLADLKEKDFELRREKVSPRLRQFEEEKKRKKKEEYYAV